MRELSILGHGDSSSKSIPTLVKNIGLVGQVACGSSHTIALSQDGTLVWSFGAGDSGKLAFLFKFSCTSKARSRFLKNKCPIGFHITTLYGSMMTIFLSEPTW